MRAVSDDSLLPTCFDFISMSSTLYYFGSREETLECLKTNSPVKLNRHVSTGKGEFQISRLFCNILSLNELSLVIETRLPVGKLLAYHPMSVSRSR